MNVATVPSTTFSEVLLASDFSEESDRALAYAKSIIRGSGGELLLVHVAQLAPVFAIEEGPWVVDPSAYMEPRETEQAAAAVRVDGLKAKAICLFGPVGQRIAQTAAIHHVDLVVMGTHGRRGLNRFVFGSYAEETAGFLETPLMIIGPRAPLTTQAIWKPTRILCSTSFSTGEAMLVAFAYLLAKKYGASFELVSFTAGASGQMNSQWRAFREAVLKLLPAQGVNEFPLHTIHVPEPRAKSLTEAAIARNIDLLVIGSENREWLTLHPGTLQELLGDAPCPIITFPTR